MERQARNEAGESPEDGKHQFGGRDDDHSRQGRETAVSSGLEAGDQVAGSRRIRLRVCPEHCPNQGQRLRTILRRLNERTSTRTTLQSLNERSSAPTTLHRFNEGACILTTLHVRTRGARAPTASHQLDNRVSGLTTIRPTKEESPAPAVMTPLKRLA